MRVSKEQIQELNQSTLTSHQRQLGHLREQLETNGVDTEALINSLQQFQVAIPSWALGAGGTRFGRYSYGGEPSSLEEKIRVRSSIFPAAKCIIVGLKTETSGSKERMKTHPPRPADRSRRQTDRQTSRRCTNTQCEEPTMAKLSFRVCEKKRAKPYARTQPPCPLFRRKKYSSQREERGKRSRADKKSCARLKIVLGQGGEEKEKSLSFFFLFREGKFSSLCLC